MSEHQYPALHLALTTLKDISTSLSKTEDLKSDNQERRRGWPKIERERKSEASREALL